MRKIAALLITLTLVCGLTIPVAAAEHEGRNYVVFRVEGDYATATRGTPHEFAAREGLRLGEGHTLSTGRDSFVYIRVDEDSLVKMDQQSRVSVSRASRERLSLTVESGNALVSVAQQVQGRTIETRVGNTALTVRGTLFVAGRSDETGTIIITMLEGSGEIEGTMVEAGSVFRMDEATGEMSLISGLDVHEMDAFTLQAVWDYQDLLLEIGVVDSDMLAAVPVLMAQRLSESEVRDNQAPQNELPDSGSQPRPSNNNRPSSGGDSGNGGTGNGGGTGSGGTGSGGTGSGGTGSGGTGSGGTGSGGTGSGGTGSGDAGSGGTGSGDAGSGGTGSGDAGSGDAGSGDAGSGGAGSGDAGSGGTPPAIYEVTTIACLQRIADGHPDNWANTRFYLRNNIGNSVMGLVSFIIPSFAGEFIGNGFTITYQVAGIDNVGLFRHLEAGGLIEDLNVVAAGVSGVNNVGGLVVWNEGTIRNIHVSGSIAGNDRTGGAVGINDGVVEDVSVNASVGRIGTAGFVGGVIGFNNSPYVSYISFVPAYQGDNWPLIGNGFSSGIIDLGLLFDWDNQEEGLTEDDDGDCGSNGIFDPCPSEPEDDEKDYLKEEPEYDTPADEDEADENDIPENGMPENETDENAADEGKADESGSIGDGAAVPEKAAASEPLSTEDEE